MAESTLSIDYSTLKQEVGFFLGYGRTEGSWSVASAAEIDQYVQSGVRRVYYPALAAQGISGYEWSFLRPSTTMAVVADDGDYDLPDDFGRLIGQLHYAPDDQYQPVTIVPVGTILDLRVRDDRNDAPCFAATRFKSSDGSDGQRQEILFWPEPDDSYTLYYKYEAYQGKLTASYPYPLGGMKMSELYLESCLAVAEQMGTNEVGLHAREYQLLLIDAIARDRKNDARYYGAMGQRETVDVRKRHGDTGGTYPITYNGEDV